MFSYMEEFRQQAKKDEKSSLQEAFNKTRSDFIRRIVTQESLYLVLRETVANELEKEIEKAAKEIADQYGYSRIVQAGKSEFGIGLADPVASIINQGYLKTEKDFDQMMLSAQSEITVREDIDIDEYFSNQPKLKKTDKKDPVSKVSSNSNAMTKGSGEALLNVGEHNIIDYAQVIWFARLSYWGKLKNSWSQGQYSFEWISPDGACLFKERTKSLIYPDLVYSTLKLTELSSIPSGKWRLKVRRKNELINDQYFEIQELKSND